MQVDVGPLEEVVGKVEPEAARVAPHVGDGGLGRFAHHVAELPGDGESPGTRHCAGLNEEDLAPGSGDRKTCRDAGFARSAPGLVVDPLVAEDLAHALRAEGCPLELSSRDSARHSPRHRTDAAFEVANARLTRVLADDRPKRGIRDAQLLRRHTRRLELARNEVALRDMELLFLGIARKLDDLHPVKERPRDGVEDVRRTDEHHPREVEREVEIVVSERAVLRRIEHFEHRGRWVAAVVTAHFVDLVDHEHGVHRVSVAKRPDEGSGHRPDVGPSMSTNFALIADTTNRDPGELALKGTGDRVSKRRLSHSGRADKAQNRRAGVRLQASHGQLFKDAVLDLLDSVVVLIEDLSSPFQIEIVLGRLIPWNRDDPVEVGPDDRVLCRGRRDPSQTVEFTLGRDAHFGGRLALVKAGSQLVDLSLSLIGLAEFLLDRFQLLTEKELSLALLHVRLDLVLDFRAKFQNLDLAI